MDYKNDNLNKTTKIKLNSYRTLNFNTQIYLY